MNEKPCEECGEEHEPAKCEKCEHCLYKTVKKQVRDNYWPIVECKCGHRQIWD